LREIATKYLTVNDIKNRPDPINSTERFQRLQDLGILKRQGNSYFLQSTWLSKVGEVCRAWANLLRFNEQDNGYISAHNPSTTKMRNNRGGETTTFLNNRNNSKRRASFFFLSVLIYLLPIILFALFKRSFIASYNESIAYRYFYAFRMLAGEHNPNLWLPQGFVTTSIQKLIIIIEDFFFSPVQQLNLSLEIFGYLTYIGHAFLAALLLFCVIFDDRLKIYQQAFIVLGLFIPIFCTNFINILIPDYYSLDTILIAGFIYYFFIIASRNNQEISLQLIAIIAFISGISVANKISLVFIVASLIILLTVRFFKERKKYLHIILISLPFFLLGWILPWLISHNPNYGLHNILDYFKLLIAFIKNAPQEYSFIDGFEHILISYPVYLWLTGLYISFGIFAFVFVLRKFSFRSEEFVLILGLFILSIIQVFLSLRTRPADSTIYEAFSILTAIVMMIAGFLKINEFWINRLMRLLLISCSILFCVSLFFGIENVININGKKIEDAQQSWIIHNFSLSQNRQIIVVVPDNSYFYGGGIEELLLKGFSDFPTWNITVGRKLLEEFSPNFEFRSEYIADKPNFPYPTDVVIMWFDKNDSNLENNKNLRELYPELNKAVSSEKVKCYRWEIAYHDRVVNMCVIP
jgi:hypothetical protein